MTARSDKSPFCNVASDEGGHPEYFFRHSSNCVTRVAEEAATKFRELQNNKDVQAQIKRLKAADRLQESRWSELLNVTQGAKSAETRMQALADGRNFVERMRKQAEAGAPTTERMVARRLLGQFSVAVSEAANDEMYRKNFSVAATLLTLLTELKVYA